MGFLSRKKEEKAEPAHEEHNDVAVNLAPKLRDLGLQTKQLASQLDKLEKMVKQMPNASDYRLLASEMARLQDEFQRMEEKHKEGMLAMYAQVHKEIRSIRGDRVIEMIDIEPVNEEKLDEASDQLSDLAKTWRKRRTQPSSSRE